MLDQLRASSVSYERILVCGLNYEFLTFSLVTTFDDSIDGWWVDAAAGNPFGIASRGRARSSDSSSQPLTPKPPHFAPKAKRVIFLFATGGVSHIETFDPKSSANGRDGSGKDKLMGSVFPYSANKRCGTEVTDLFPHLRESMDEICVIRSMKSAHFDHTEAAVGMHTGSPTFARPSMGSWISYGLGTFNQNLPSFIVIAPHLPYGGTQVYASDFLPAYHQGTRVIPGEQPIENLTPRTKLREIQELNLALRMPSIAAI